MLMLPELRPHRASSGDIKAVVAIDAVTHVFLSGRVSDCARAVRLLDAGDVGDQRTTQFTASSAAKLQCEKAAM
jgi:hypothetical protein